MTLDQVHKSPSFFFRHFSYDSNNLNETKKQKIKAKSSKNLKNWAKNLGFMLLAKRENAPVENHSE